MTVLRIKQVRGAIGQSRKHRGTLRALGLRKIGTVVEHKQSPVLNGMLERVRHLVHVEEKSHSGR